MHKKKEKHHEMKKHAEKKEHGRHKAVKVHHGMKGHKKAKQQVISESPSGYHHIRPKADQVTFERADH